MIILITKDLDKMLQKLSIYKKISDVSIICISVLINLQVHLVSTQRQFMIYQYTISGWFSIPSHIPDR
jgi:hypothetical protein